MEDKEKMSEDLPNGSEIELVDASVQQKEEEEEEETPILPKKNQNPSPSGPLTHPGTKHEDNNLELRGPDDVKVDSKGNGTDAGLGEPPDEGKGSGRNVVVENQPKKARPTSPERFFTPKAVHSNVGEVNNGLDDTEVLEMGTRHNNSCI